MAAKADVARFASKLAGNRATLKRNECWRWGGTFDRNGYGTFSVGGRTVRAHRFSYEAAKGRPPQKHVLHKCGNRWCVNPHHLSDGTREENVEDMRRHGTLAVGKRNGARKHPESVARGERAGAAKLSASQVRSIRKAASSGVSVGDLARKHGVHKSTISRVINRVQWGHIKR